MPQDAQEDPQTQLALSTARYLRSAIGDLAKLAQKAQLEHTEAMLLAAKIEAGHAVKHFKALTLGTPQSAVPREQRFDLKAELGLPEALQSWLDSKAAATRPPGDDDA